MTAEWINFFTVVGITTVAYIFVFGFLPYTEVQKPKRKRRKRK